MRSFILENGVYALTVHPATDGMLVSLSDDAGGHTIFVPDPCVKDLQRCLTNYLLAVDGIEDEDG